MQSKFFAATTALATAISTTATAAAAADLTYHNH